MGRRSRGALLEELGVALMDVAVPNERQHEFMDQIMDGEGSSSLEAMHRSMGYSFLASGGTSGPGVGIRGPGGWGMMGPGMMGGWGWGGGRFGGAMSAGIGVWIPVAILAAAVVVLALSLAARRRR